MMELVMISIVYIPSMLAAVWMLFKANGVTVE